MQVERLGKIGGGQDGAIWGDYLFRFDASGRCCVYAFCDGDETPKELGRFVLDKVEQLKPHSNSVMFGNEYYADEDEFPLLYSNIYNNYASAEDKLEGVTCVYRVWREDGVFFSRLVQVIRVGFTEDSLWRSENGADVRPYGNFAIDRERSLYYAFTMRDEEHMTRYFAFRLPKACQGEENAQFGAKLVVLNKDDICDQFDCEYHRFVQGACCHNGVVYSLEGFSEGAMNPAGLRIIDTREKEQKAYIALFDYDLKIEPEFVDFLGEICYYSDSHGALYRLSF